jgi:hypothetical protein
MSDNMHGGRYKVSTPHVIHEAIDGEVIVINLATGTYYSLRGSAAEAWELIQQPDGVTADELLATMADRLDVPSQRLRVAFAPFLAELQEEGLVEANGIRKLGIAESSSSNGEGPADIDVPRLEKFTDMQELVLLDPVHEVDQAGWPSQPEAAAADSA